MSPSDRPAVVSRRHLVRALLGREIPPAGPDARPPAGDPHAAGDTAFAAGDFPAAVAAYRTSVRGDLSNAAVRIRLGQALYALGQSIQARVEFEHALRLSEGSNVTARLGLALCLLGLGKTAKAAAFLADLADPEHPELEALAREQAAALAAETPPDPAPARDALLRLAQALSLFPETA